MTIVRNLAVAFALTCSVAAVGCAADTEEEEGGASGATQEAVSGQCQSDDSATWKGVDCHDTQGVYELCASKQQGDEDLIDVIDPRTNQDSNWKTVRCKFSGRSTSVRCCDVS